MNDKKRIRKNVFKRINNVAFIDRLPLNWQIALRRIGNDLTNYINRDFSYKNKKKRLKNQPPQ